MTDTIITLPRAVVEQALEALTCTGEHDDPGHRCTHCDDYVDRNGPTRAALRAALEQPQVEQEPVSKSDNYLNGYCTGRTDLLKELQVEQEPVAEVIESHVRTSLDGLFTAEVASRERLSVGAELFIHPQPPRQPQKGWKLVGWWHQADDPDECDFFYADAINGDCPSCHPCYADIGGEK